MNNKNHVNVFDKRVQNRTSFKRLKASGPMRVANLNVPAI